MLYLFITWLFFLISIFNNELPRLCLVLDVEWPQVVTFEHVLQVEVVIGIVVRVLVLLILLSLLLDFVELFVSSQVEVRWLLLEGDVAAPGDQIVHNLISQVLNYFEPLEWVSAIQELHLDLKLGQLIVELELKVHFISVVVHVDEAVVQEEHRGEV